MEIAGSIDRETAIAKLADQYEAELYEMWDGDLLARYRTKVDKGCTRLVDSEENTAIDWMDDAESAVAR